MVIKVTLLFKTFKFCCANIISIGNHTHSSPIWEIVHSKQNCTRRSRVRFVLLRVQLFPKSDENVCDCY